MSLDNITIETQICDKKYNYAYCLKNKHQQSQKKYLCLEEQCSSKKNLCLFCFQEENEHSQHQVIQTETLLNIARQKLILSKIPQQIEQIDTLIERFKSRDEAQHLTLSLLQLKHLLMQVINLHLQKEYSIFQTNSIIELTYQLICYNRNMRQIKQPQSLHLTEFELSIETISSVLYIIKFEFEQLNKNTQPDAKLIEFEEFSKQKNIQQDIRNNQKKPKKIKTRRKSLSYPQNAKGNQINNESIHDYIKTNFQDQENGLTQQICQQQQQEKSQELPPQIIKKTFSDQKQINNNNLIEDNNENNNELKINKDHIIKTPLQKVIENYNKTDEISIDTSQMQIVQRAHEGIIYNMIDLGEGSGNTINQIVTLGEDGFMKFWNPSDLRCLHVINLKNQNEIDQTIIKDIQYLKRIKCIAAVSENFISIINVKTYKIIKRIYVEANNLDSCDQLGLLFLVNQRNKCILIYNFFTFQQVGQLPSQEEEITSLAYAKKGSKYYYFTGDKNGYLNKYDLEEKQLLMRKKVNRITIFYISTCRYKSSDESIITFCCNDFVKSSYIKIINIDTFEVIENLNYSVIDSAICWNNEIYLLQSNNNIIQIIADQHIIEKKMCKIPSSFGKGLDVFNEGLRWVRCDRVAILSQFTRTQHYSNLIKFPIFQKNI